VNDLEARQKIREIMMQLCTDLLTQFGSMRRAALAENPRPEDDMCSVLPPDLGIINLTEEGIQVGQLKLIGGAQDSRMFEAVLREASRRHKADATYIVCEGFTRPMTSEAEVDQYRKEREAGVNLKDASVGGEPIETVFVRLNGFGMTFMAQSTFKDDGDIDQIQFIEDGIKREGTRTESRFDNLGVDDKSLQIPEKDLPSDGFH